MEAGTRICSHCGLRRLTETECPACGGPTYAPHVPQASDPVEAPREAGPPLAGLVVALVGAGVLLASLSLPWYAIDLPSGLRGLLDGVAQQAGSGGFAQDLEADAWEAFEIADVALAGAAGLSFILIAAAVMGRASAATVSRALQVTGGFVIGLTLFRMVDQPDPAPLLAVRSGPWIALLAGGAIVLGSGLIAARAR